MNDYPTDINYEPTRFVDRREIFQIKNTETNQAYYLHMAKPGRNKKDCGFYYFAKYIRPNAIITKLEFAKLNKIVVITKARNGVSIPILKDKTKYLQDMKLIVEKELAQRQENLQYV